MKKNKNHKVLPRRQGYKTNQSCMPPLAKQQINQMIKSGAAKPLTDFIAKKFPKKADQVSFLNECLWQACQIFQPFLRLQDERNKQDACLEILAQDLKKWECHGSKNPNSEDFLNTLRLKKHIACQHSNFAQRGEKDLSKYALVFFLNHIFLFLNTETRKKLIANLLVISGLSSAVCFEAVGETKLRRFIPVDLHDGRPKISGKKVIVSKPTLHTRCTSFPGNADTDVSVDLFCVEKFCSREAVAFIQRRKRAERLFAAMLASEEYKQFMNERLAVLKQSPMDGAKRLGPKEIVRLQHRVKSEYLMYEFLKLTARLGSNTNIYLDELPEILREVNIPRQRLPDIYKNLTRDREFWTAFKVFFCPTVRSKA